MYKFWCRVILHDVTLNIILSEPLDTLFWKYLIICSQHNYSGKLTCVCDPAVCDFSPGYGPVTGGAPGAVPSHYTWLPEDPAAGTTLAHTTGNCSWVILPGSTYLTYRRMLEMTLGVSTSAGKHVTTNYACAYPQRHHRQFSLFIGPNNVVRFDVT